MPDIAMSELRLTLPKRIANSLTAQEIIRMLLTQATAKAEYYRRQCKLFEDKYGMSLRSFKERVETAEPENIVEWDDFIVWDDYHTAFKAWQKDYRELKVCNKLYGN